MDLIRRVGWTRKKEIVFVKTLSNPTMREIIVEKMAKVTLIVGPCPSFLENERRRTFLGLDVPQMWTFRVLNLPHT